MNRHLACAVVSEEQQIGFRAKFESDLPRRQQRIENSGAANALGARIGFRARAPGLQHRLRDHLSPAPRSRPGVRTSPRYAQMQM